MQRLSCFGCALGVLILVCFSEGAPSDTSAEHAGHCGAYCDRLEILRQNVAAACSTSAVAGLSQMSASCALAASFTASDEVSESHAQYAAKTPIETLFTPRSAATHQHAPMRFTGAETQDGDLNDDLARFEGHTLRAFRSQRARRRRRDTSFSSSVDTTRCSNDTRAAVLKTLCDDCPVRGCIWLKIAPSSKTDLTLACADAGAIAGLSNHTACPALVQSCSVTIQLYIGAAPMPLTLLQNAAALLGIWKSNASVTLRGHWGPRGLGAVLQRSQKLVELDAGSAGVTALNGDTLQTLTSLRVLSLTRNSIHSVHPNALSKLTSLETLDLSANRLTSLPLQLLHKCVALISLDLGNNRLTSLDEMYFQGPVKLERLVLNWNQLPRLGGGLFGSLSQLTHLELASNKLTSVDENAFQGLSALSALTCSDNQLLRLPDSVFHGLSALHTIDIHRNKLTAIDSPVFQGLAAISELDLSENLLTRLAPRLFSGLGATLVRVFLAYNRLERLDAAIFSGLSSLEVLYLTGNMLTLLPTGLFRGLANLELLTMESNQLIDFNVTDFHELRSLKGLTIAYNKVTRLQGGLFRGLCELQGLDIGPNKLTTLNANLLVGLSALTALGLNGNRLTSLPTSLFHGSPKLRALSVAQNNLLDFDMMVFQGLSALEVLSLSSNPFTNLEGGLFLVPSELSKLSELGLVSTGISRLQLSANIKLDYLNLAHSHRLAEISSTPATRVAAADVTGTALHIEDLPCDSLGHIGLVARNMQHMSSLDVLNSCMGRDRLFLDVSNNAETHVEAVRDVLSTEAASFLMGNESWRLRPGKEHVRRQPVDLILVGSPVQCSLRTVQSWVYHEPTSFQYYPEPLEMFTCSCIPGYYEDDGVCKKEVPFLARAGGIALVVLGTLLFAGLLAIFRKRQQGVKRRLHHARHDLEMHRGLLEYAETEVLALKRAWELEANELTLVKRIDGDSEGAFGAVWRGDWDGMAVAVKVLRAGLLALDSRMADEFDREAEFLMRARHSNVVRFFGAGRMPSGEPFLVLELIARGSLRGLLRGRSSSRMNKALKQRLALDIARGMAYIHSLGALHRDLKSGNVLVTENWRAKVADFGSMRTLLASAAACDISSRTGCSADGTSGAASAILSHVGDLTLTAGVGTPLYMALEVLRGHKYGEAADVWAFGVMVWELMEERSPDLLVETGDEARGGPMLGRLLKLLEAGSRLQLGTKTPAWAQRIVRECTVAEASERPSFLVLKDRLTMDSERAEPEDMEYV